LLPWNVEPESGTLANKKYLVLARDGACAYLSYSP